MCFRKFTKSVLFCVTLILFGSILAAAQVGSSIAGDVVDINGAAIPGARVTAIDPKTNLQQVVETNTNGFFIFQLNPGIYTIRVEKDGFKTKEKTRVVLNSLERINAGEFVLETGTVSEVVTVEADQAQLQLQTESGERSNVITNDQLKDLAINGRNTLDLLVTIPGFSGDSNSGAAAGADQKVSGPQSVLLGFSINGSRQGQSNFTVDGATNIDVGDNGATVVTVNPDAVAEVKVLTSNYQAEFGRAGGAQISIVTRGGGNQFRGGARYFRRHDSLNANNFFSNASNPYIPRPLYRYNYYGYDISGPIYLPRFGEGGSPYWSGKDRLFFYWNQEFYDQSRIPAGISRLRVPTAAERAGNFSQTTDGNGNKIYIRDPLKSGTCSATNQEACFPGNIIPADRFYANGTNILNQYPLPNLEGNPQYNYVFQDFNRYPRREDILRIDFKVNEANRLSGRFINNYDEQIRPFGGSFVAPQNLPITYISQIQPGQTASLSLESNMMGSTLFNEFTVAFSRMKISIDAEDPEKLTPGGTGINIPWLYPNSSISGYIPSFAYGGIINQGFPSNSLNPLPFAPNRRLFNISDKITKVVGNHTIKGGIFIQDSVNNRLGNYKEYWDIIESRPRLQGGFIWEWIDQGLDVIKNGKRIMAYGGDFPLEGPVNEDFSDNNFCIKGVVTGYRELTPMAIEIKKVHQSVKTNYLGNNKISVGNGYFFRDISNYKLNWELVENGRISERGTVENLDIKPRETNEISLPIKAKPANGKEYFLNVRYLLKSSEPFLEKNYEIAYEQFPLSNTPRFVPQVSAKGKLSLTETADEFFLKGTGFRIAFDSKKGALKSYVYDGEEFLQSVEPAYWRAPTDNDIGAGYNRKLRKWRAAYDEGKLLSAVAGKNADGTYTVSFRKELLGGDAIQEQIYTIFADGNFKVENNFKAVKGSYPLLLRMGNNLRMAGSLSNIEFYGRGPWENYWDRKTASLVGIYKQTLKQQYFPYARPQESGNKTDIRYVNFTNAKGKGLQFIPEDNLLAFSALPYNLDDLDPETDKKQYHSGELVERKEIYAHIDMQQTGLQGIDSWGSAPLEKYRIPFADHRYAYYVIPIK